MAHWTCYDVIAIAAQNKYETIEELLEMVSSIRSDPRLYSELLLAHYYVLILYLVKKKSTQLSFNEC
jgi:hypothetical protein